MEKPQRTKQKQAHPFRRGSEEQCQVTTFRFAPKSARQPKNRKEKEKHARRKEKDRPRLQRKTRRKKHRIQKRSPSPSPIKPHAERPRERRNQKQRGARETYLQGCNDGASRDAKMAERRSKRSEEGDPVDLKAPSDHGRRSWRINGTSGTVLSVVRPFGRGQPVQGPSGPGSWVI